MMIDKNKAQLYKDIANNILNTQDDVTILFNLKESGLSKPSEIIANHIDLGE
jgi:uncharacterized Zn ribbon protein